MKQNRWVLACVVASIWLAHEVRSEEPARKFLDALRERNYYDVALDYLEQMATSPLAPIELKESLVYEKGVTLIEASRFQKDNAIREKQINEAQQLFTQFVAQRGDHALANAARNQLGNLIVERARIKLEAASKGDKAKNLSEAKKLYDEAYAVFTKLRTELKEQLERIPKFLDEKDKQSQLLAEKRTQLRADYLQTLLLAAAIREETSETVDPKSKEYTDLVTDAANQYGEIYESHRTRLAGLYARMYQGRCMQKLKKFPDALGFLTELLDQPADADAFRALIVKALRHAIECWIDPSQKKYVEAIKRGEDWVNNARGAEERHPDWLHIRMLLVRAYLMQADEAKSPKPNERVIDQSLAAARKHANFVARISSEFQKEAQAYVAQLGGPDRTGKKGEVKSFADAKNYAKESIDAMQTASLLIKELPAQLGREKDPAKKAELQQKLEEAQKLSESSVDEALGYCRAALAMVNEEVELDDVNFIRYLLCFLNYTKKDYFDAALIGEFVAKRYPDSAGARQSAKIAMASYLQLYNENKTEDKKFETDRVISIAEFISTSWPDQPEAEEALGTLVPFMINAGELTRALEFVAKIPESSGKRGEAELKTGQALWGAYLKGLNEILVWEKDGVPAGKDVNARKQELEGLKSKAMELLTSGYARVQKKSAADRTSALALLSLAQVYVESEQPLKAIEVLEHATLGPLKLVADKHPAAQEPTFVEEAYKTALRAYIGALPVAADRTATQAKAQDTMNKMKEAVSQQKDGQQRLIAVFVSLARSIEEQLKVAQPAAKKVLSESFESFLKQIRGETKDFNILNWVAETFNGLGGGFDDGKTLTAEAKHYYEESASTFTKILAEVQLEPQMKTQMQVRLAFVSRRMRDFKQAIDTYKEVLTANNMLVNVQVEAARTYQEWAASRTETVFYERAIAGSYPDATGKNIIWGWGRVSQTAARYPNFRDTFHEASINLAQCRLLLAEKKQGADRDKLLKSAANGIAVVYRLLPDLGGDKWMPQYNAVLMQIQRAQGVTPLGLKALPAPAKSPSVPANSASTVSAAGISNKK